MLAEAATACRPVRGHATSSLLFALIKACCTINSMVNEARYFYWAGAGPVSMVPAESLYDLAPDSSNSS